MKSLLGVLMACLVVTACATQASGLDGIRLGYTRAQVSDELGAPIAIHEPVHNLYGQTIRVLEYSVADSSERSSGGVLNSVAFLTLGTGSTTLSRRRVDVWLYFMDGNLVKCSDAGDWRQEAKRIHRVRFVPGRTN